MTYLIDSDWVASFLRGRQDAHALFQRLAPMGIAISLITYGEIYEGIYYVQDPMAIEGVFRRFLRGVTILPLNQTMMREFARVRGDLRRSGQIIGDADILIGVTALYHNLTIVTRNTSHFQRIPNLQLYLAP